MDMNAQISIKLTVAESLLLVSGLATLKAQLDSMDEISDLKKGSIMVRCDDIHEKITKKLTELTDE